MRHTASLGPLRRTTRDVWATIAFPSKTRALAVAARRRDGILPPHTSHAYEEVLHSAQGDGRRGRRSFQSAAVLAAQPLPDWNAGMMDHYPDPPTPVLPSHPAHTSRKLSLNTHTPPRSARSSPTRFRPLRPGSNAKTRQEMELKDALEMELANPPPIPGPNTDDSFFDPIDLPSDDVTDDFSALDAMEAETPQGTVDWEYFAKMKASPPAEGSLTGTTVQEQPRPKDRRKERKERVKAVRATYTTRDANIKPKLLPQLEADGYPPDGMTRFDWRTRAFGRSGRTPAVLNRQQPNLRELSFDHPMSEALTRYSKHFNDLLDLERDEQYQSYTRRINEWGTEKLLRHGFALENLRGASDLQKGWPVKKGRKVYKFIKARGSRMSTEHFGPGTNVIVSRTHPLKDPVLNHEGDTISASVLTSTAGSVTVMSQSAIPKITEGEWRLDLGFSDFMFEKQEEAIAALNLDPFHLDMSGFVGRDGKPDLSGRGVSSAWVKPSADHVPLRQEEFILRGTTLRAPLFRAFQQDYVPPHLASFPDGSPHGSPDGDGIVQDPNVLAPTDLDTVPNPDITAVASKKEVRGGMLSRDLLIKSWAERHRSEREVPLAVVGDPVVPLNRTQLRAMGMILSESLSLVQGPPGTGKTRVIVETIKLLKAHFQIPHPILVCAHTNAAVDNLLSGLTKNGINAVRSGLAEKVPDELRKWTLERKLEQHPDWQAYSMLDDDMKRMKAQRRDPNFKPSSDDDVALSRVRAECYTLKRKMIPEVLLSVDVICVTCLSAASQTLKYIDFPIVFLDEASMATEPLSLIPLMKGSSHVAIIGDHKQLPPVIVSHEAHKGGLSTSLFERLIHEGHVPSIMLDTQYRMHPAISAFPSKTFYSGLLQDGTPASHLPAPDTAFLLPKDPVLDPATGEMRETGERNNVTFWSHDHPETAMMKSLANHGDAELVIDIVADLLYRNPDMKGCDIGIITPYIAQIATLKSDLSSESTLVNLGRLLGSERQREIDDIEVRTVDGFEGREKDVIIFSTVRSNPGGYIGFLGDWRRVNVGLTRARRALIMVGSKTTLRVAKMGALAAEKLPRGGTKVWKDYMAFLEQEGLLVDVKVEDPVVDEPSNPV